MSLHNNQVIALPGWFIRVVLLNVLELIQNRIRINILLGDSPPTPTLGCVFRKKNLLHLVPYIMPTFKISWESSERHHCSTGFGMLSFNLHSITTKFAYRAGMGRSMWGALGSRCRSCNSLTHKHNRVTSTATNECLGFCNCEPQVLSGMLPTDTAVRNKGPGTYHQKRWNSSNTLNKGQGWGKKGHSYTKIGFYHC